MKRYLYIFAVLTAFSLMSTSCITNNTQSEINQNTQDTNIEPTPIIPEETTETETAQTTDVFRLLDSAEPYGQGLLHIPNAYVEQGLLQHMLPFQEHALIWGNRLQEDNTSVLELALLSLSSGEILYKTGLPNIELPDIAVCDNQIIISDWSDGEIYFFDESLNQTLVLNSGTTSVPFYLSTDGTQLYCFGQEGISQTDLGSQATTPIIENVVNLFVNTRTGNYVSFSYIDPNTQLTVRGYLNLENGSFARLPFEGSFGTAAYANSLWLAPTADSDYTYYLGKDGRPNMFTLPEGSSRIDFLPEENRLLAFSHKTDGSQAMTLYDTDGTFISKCDLGIVGAGLSYEPIWLEQGSGYIFTITDPAGKDLLLFWDLSTPSSGTDLQLKAAYEPEPFGQAVAEELYTTAAALGKTYGITIKIADQTQSEFYDFYAAPEYDETYIKDALITLEKVCSAYPDGFFHQLLYGNTMEIQFHLTGELTKTDLTEGDTSGFTSFSGFTTDGEGRTTVAVNIARPGSLEQTLHHEIAHLIDNKLTFDARIRENALYSDKKWETLNPEGFKYADSYTNLPMEFYNDGYENWFMELYSRTFIREDRATIMEYAMAGYSWAFNTPERIAKLEYWSTCIRDSFNAEGWPDMTSWEYTLSQCKSE